MSLPNAARFERDQAFLHGQERLFVVISGGTASQTYVAAASIVDYQEGAPMPTVSYG